MVPGGTIHATERPQHVGKSECAKKSACQSTSKTFQAAQDILSRSLECVVCSLDAKYELR